MTDVVYFMGTEDIHFENYGSPSVSTNSSTFRSAWARCSLQAIGGVEGWGNWWIPSVYGLSLTAFWLTAEYFYNGSNVNTLIKPVIIFYNSTDVPQLALFGSAASPTWQLYKVTGPDPSNFSNLTLLQTGLAGGFSFASLHKLDLFVDTAGGRFTIHSPGEDSGGGPLLDYGGDLSFAGAITGWSFGGSNGSINWSEIALASCDTRSIVGLRSLVPDAVGAVDAWSGTVTDINEIVNNDITINETDTANLVQEYHVTGLPAGLPTDAYVRAVMVGARMATGPTDVSVLLRPSVTDDPQGSFSTGGAFLNKRHIWETNPETTMPFTVAQVNNAAFNIGVKSA